MCVHGMCLVCLRDREWGRLTGEKFLREKQGRGTWIEKCKGLEEKGEEFVFHSVTKRDW